MSLTSLRCSTDASSENGSIPKTVRGKLQSHIKNFIVFKKEES
jgi:hypothetical protein